MASSSVDSNPETSSGARYRLTRTLRFNDIRSKFATREVLTENFSCQYDSVPTDFRMEIGFGNSNVVKEKDEIDEEYLQVAIGSKRRNDATLTSLRIELFDDRWKLLDSWEEESTDLEFYGRGFYNFYKFDATSESASSWNLIIDLVYKALPKPSAVTTVDQPQLRLQEEYSQLLDSGKESDVTFVVQGEIIKAHKLVLTTRCRHFDSMFDSGMAETHSKEVKINDIKPKAFKDFLRFLYTGVASKYEEDSTMELLAAADKYCVDDLKMICEKEINANLNGDNVIDALILAEKHNCPTLLTSAKAVFGWNAKALKTTEAWNKLLANPTVFEHLV